MARSNYELHAEIFGADEVGRIVDADRAVQCNLCTEEDTAVGRRNLTALATWWMADVGRGATDVRTRIAVDRKLDGSASEAWFAIEVPRWNKAIRIFMATVQHTVGPNHPKRKRFHYQLQVP